MFLAASTFNLQPSTFNPLVRGVRADRALVERGLVESREKGQALILAGEVFVGDERVRSASTLVAPEADLRVAEPPKYVSRGGFKLEAALDGFGISPDGLICADVGASNGGFTDCLLQRGAVRVYAIDVGYGQLEARIRADPRVVVLDRTNARHLEYLPEPIALVTIDVSFISLKLILPAVRGWLAPSGQVLAMVKPQFEAGRGRVGKGGVVRDPVLRAETVLGVSESAEALGLMTTGVCPSPIVGPAGNREYFLWLRRAGPGLRDVAVSIGQAVQEERVIVA